MSKTNQKSNVIETGGDKPDCAPVSLLGGVSRKMVMLAAGYIIGLSETRRYEFDDRERKILTMGGHALKAAGEKLYAS